MIENVTRMDRRLVLSVYRRDLTKTLVKGLGLIPLLTAAYFGSVYLLEDERFAFLFGFFLILLPINLLWMIIDHVRRIFKATGVSSNCVEVTFVFDDSGYDAAWQSKIKDVRVRYHFDAIRRVEVKKRYLLIHFDTEAPEHLDRGGFRVGTESELLARFRSLGLQVEDRHA